MIIALIRISYWLGKTNLIASDSEDYKIISKAIDLIAYHYGVEAGREAAKGRV